MAKLYAWQPKGHGQLSWFVVAESEESAKKFVDAEIERLLERAEIAEYEFHGWGTDCYMLTVADVGEVVANDNS